MMSKNIDIHVGSRLRRTREFRGLSQRELALALRLTVERLDAFERGAARLSASVLFAASQRLGVDGSFFFKGLKGFEDAGREAIAAEPSGRNGNVYAFPSSRARLGPASAGETPPTKLCL